MVPNNDITNNSHNCNKDMDDKIITTATKTITTRTTKTTKRTTTTTKITCDEQKLYWRNPNKYSTQATSTTHFSNVCGSGGCGVNNDCTNTSSFITI